MNVISKRYKTKYTVEMSDEEIFLLICVFRKHTRDTLSNAVGIGPREDGLYYRLMEKALETLRELNIHPNIKGE